MLTLRATVLAIVSLALAGCASDYPPKVSGQALHAKDFDAGQVELAMYVHDAVGPDRRCVDYLVRPLRSEERVIDWAKLRFSDPPHYAYVDDSAPTEVIPAWGDGEKCSFRLNPDDEPKAFYDEDPVPITRVTTPLFRRNGTIRVSPA